MLGKLKTFMSDHRGSVEDTIHIHLQATLLLAVGLRMIMLRHMYQVPKARDPYGGMLLQKILLALYVHRVCSKLGKWPAYLLLLLERL